MRRGTFQWMKSVNKSMILNKIRTSAPISRAQIARETKLTPPTVSNNVKELLEQGIVRESDLGESQGGRKPTLLLINDKAFYVIGVDAGPQNVECILADLSGNIMERNMNKLSKDITNHEYLTILKASIQDILDKTTIKKDKIIGIGVAMHGVVEVETGTSLYAPNIGLTNIPIKDELEKEFNLEVEVENDARVMALGESWFGNHGEVESMLTVNLGHGVGAGMIANGKLYHGAQDIAGEVGHMTIDINGEECECGNKGCFQTFATGSAIAKRAQSALQGSTVEADLVDFLTAEKVYELALLGNTECMKVLTNVGAIIGIALTNLIHILNPNKIVLGGGVTKAEKFLLPVIKETIKERALTPQAKETEVCITELGDDATVIGAVALLLVGLFDPV